MKTKKIRVIRIALPADWAQRVWAVLCVALDSTGCPDYSIEMDHSDVTVPDNRGKVTEV